MPDDPIDPEDGETTNPVLAAALAVLSRQEDDLDDLAHINRATDEYWFVSLCLDRLHALPSVVNEQIGCREYTMLRAHAILRDCYDQEARRILQHEG